MRKKLNIKIVFYILLFVILICGNKVYATNTVSVQFNTGILSDEINSINLWKLDDKLKDSDKENIEKLKFYNDKLKVLELNKKFEIKKLNFYNGISYIELNNGIYYFRDSSDKPISSGIITLFDNKAKVIYLKKNYISFSNNLKIVKYLDKLSDKNRAEGIIFRLYKKSIDTNSYELVSVRDNEYDKYIKNYNLTTNKQGEINIKKLPSGKYMLKEIKTEDGYELLKPLEFELGSDSVKNISLVNKKLVKNRLVKTGVGINYKFLIIFTVLIVIFGIILKVINIGGNDEK